MTDQEHSQLSEFKHLPLEDEREGLEYIDNPAKASPRQAWTLHEAETLAEARQFLKTPNLTPKGAIRYWDGKPPVPTIRVYFWEEIKP